MIDERHLHEIRRRAPSDLDVSAIVEQAEKEAAAGIAAWRSEWPGLNAAILEIELKASGQTRRRLRRYREISDYRGPPGRLIYRHPTNLDQLVTLDLIRVRVAAARAGATDISWRLLTIDEALRSGQVL